VEDVKCKGSPLVITIDFVACEIWCRIVGWPAFGSMSYAKVEALRDDIRSAGTSDRCWNLGNHLQSLS